MIVLTLGIVFISQAYNYGDAGPNEAIKNSCTVIQTVITAFAAQKVPTVLQIIGLIAGFGGVLVIVLQNTKKAGDEKDENGDIKESEANTNAVDKQNEQIKEDPDA